MQHLLYSVFLAMVIFGCQNKGKKTTALETNTAVQIIENDDYEFISPHKKTLATLVLFGGYPETPADIKREFDILESAQKNGIALLLMKFNRRLWLEENEKVDLKNILELAFNKHKLPTEKVFIGGFSSGGNVSLLLSNYLVKMKSKIQPEGVFIVDSPVDFLQLYESSKRNVERNFSEISVQESKGIIAIFDKYFGLKENGIQKYETYSPFTSDTKNIQNLKLLNGLKIRMYTEPDTVWWKENRQNEYEDLNACYIKKLASQLKHEFGPDKIELIETQNRGKRAQGYRHPHSWSIVEKIDLVKWIFN